MLFTRKRLQKEELWAPPGHLPAPHRPRLNSALPGGGRGPIPSDEDGIKRRAWRGAGCPKSQLTAPLPVELVPSETGCQEKAGCPACWADVGLLLEGSLCRASSCGFPRRLPRPGVWEAYLGGPEGTRRRPCRQEDRAGGGVWTSAIPGTPGAKGTPQGLSTCSFQASAKGAGCRGCAERLCPWQGRHSPHSEPQCPGAPPSGVTNSKEGAELELTRKAHPSPQHQACGVKSHRISRQRISVSRKASWLRPWPHTWGSAGLRGAE